MSANPYTLARLTPDGAVYCGEIHAAPVNDTDRVPEELTPTMLRMLESSYPAKRLVDAALDREGDRSLEAEVRRYRGQDEEAEEIAALQQAIDRRKYRLDMERGMCRHRLRAANAISRIVDEMVVDTQVQRIRRGNSIERGRRSWKGDDVTDARVNTY
jgi:hypothetical protein